MTHSFPTRRPSDLVTMRWNELEQAVERIIWILLGGDYDAGQCVTTHVGNVTRTQILFSLSEYRNSSDAHEAIAHLRSEEHTSELQSLMRISYAVFCLKKKTELPCIIHRYDA